MPIDTRYELTSFISISERADIPSRTDGTIRISRDAGGATIVVTRTGDTVDFVLPVDMDTPAPAMLDQIIMWLFSRPCPYSVIP